MQQEAFRLYMKFLGNYIAAHGQTVPKMHQGVHMMEELRTKRSQIGDDVDTPHFEPYKDEETPSHSVPDRDDCQAFDQYIGAEVTLPMGDQQ